MQNQEKNVIKFTVDYTTWPKTITRLRSFLLKLVSQSQINKQFFTVFCWSHDIGTAISCTTHNVHCWISSSVLVIIRAAIKAPRMNLIGYVSCLKWQKSSVQKLRVLRVMTRTQKGQFWLCYLIIRQRVFKTSNTLNVWYILV